MDSNRRNLLGITAGAGVLATLPGTVLAQAKPAAPAPAPAGTIANEAIKAEKAKGLQWHSERPLTGSVPAHEHDFDVTPTDRMFVRNNLFTPDLDAAKHRLTIKGLVERELSFSMEELKAAFPAVSVQGMVECAGSGRTAFQPTPRGTPWSPTGGMGCPIWNGVRLADILRYAGLKEGAAHVAGQGGDFGAVATVAPVIRSVPMAKAMDDETLVAWGINGAPLPRVHGFPLRLVVPGWAGSASTKWLHTLTVLNAPFKGTYMEDSYRIPKHPIAAGGRMPADAVTTEGWPIKSIITSPAPGALVKGADRIVVRGRAWVGEGAVDRVEISVDEGVTWYRAELGRARDARAWRTFTFDYQPQRFGYVTFLARAWDNRGNAQPMTSYWNPLGYFWNGVPRVGVVVEA